MTTPTTVERIPGYCALCISRCGSIAVVEDGRFVALEPDPSHPTGQALCAKGRAAPELVYHPDRLLYPLKRTRPKGDPDPGWQRISWDEALDLTAANLRRLAERHGPESVVFSCASPSTSAIADSVHWIQRLMRAFGTPNLCVSMELCGWGRVAAAFTFGVGFGLGSGSAMPDLEHAGCILFWGYNPSIARISHATATVAALKRGARLIVVDPRRVGLANKADLWLRVRPGSDGALALGIAGVMIERGWYDRDFVRDWTNGPLLVRADTGRLLTERDLSPEGSASTLRRLGRSRRPPAPLRPGHPPLRARRCRARPLRRVHDRHARWRAHLPARVPTRRRSLPALHPGDGRGDLLGRTRPGRGGGPPALGGAPRRLLRLERRRAAHQRHPDRPRPRTALRAHRQLRRAGRQRALPVRAVRQRRR